MYMFIEYHLRNYVIVVVVRWRCHVKYKQNAIVQVSCMIRSHVCYLEGDAAERAEIHPYVLSAIDHSRPYARSAALRPCVPALIRPRKYRTRALVVCNIVCDSIGIWMCV